jgi:hypothetical protein
MKILFDQGTPVPLRREMGEHVIRTAFEMGWATLANGELLQAAAAEFDILLTTDQNLPHQQNLKGIDLAVVILPTTSWSVIRQNTHVIREALLAARSATISQVSFPP